MVVWDFEPIHITKFHTPAYLAQNACAVGFGAPTHAAGDCRGSRAYLHTTRRRSLFYTLLRTSHSRSHDEYEKWSDALSNIGRNFGLRMTHDLWLSTFVADFSQLLAKFSLLHNTSEFFQVPTLNEGRYSHK